MQNKDTAKHGTSNVAVPVVERTDGGVAVTYVVQQIAPDELRPITSFAKAWELEPSGLLREAKRAGFVIRIGRQQCARRSDLLKLVELLAAKRASKPTTAASDYASIVAHATQRRAG
jgi:hypothetical protein